MKMKHVHAELMMQYAQDALETDKPWERWEKSLWGNPWRALEGNPAWGVATEYRRKPNGKTVLIDGQEFIVPKSFEPNIGDAYFCFSSASEDVAEYKHQDRHFDYGNARSGNCYRTEEEAEQALKFWRKINEV